MTLNLSLEFGYRTIQLMLIFKINKHLLKKLFIYIIFRVYKNFKFKKIKLIINFYICRIFYYSNCFLLLVFLYQRFLVFFFFINILM